MESFQLSLSLRCSGCQHPVPVQRIEAFVTCQACGERISMPLSRWQGLFEPGLWLEVLAMEPGTGRSMQVWGSVNASVSLCRVDVPEERGRAPDELVSGFVPGVVSVLGEEAAEPMPQAREPVFFACLSCGGGLKVDGSERMVGCQHCEASCYLPDGLWRELNPVPRVRDIALVCEIPEHQRVALILEHGDEEQKAQLASSCQDPVVLERLAEVDDEDVQLALVGRADERRLQLLLALSERWKVRRALAWRELDLDILEKLAEDGDGDVREAARQNNAWRAAHPVVALATPPAESPSMWREPLLALLLVLVCVGVFLGIGLALSR